MPPASRLVHRLLLVLQLLTLIAPGAAACVRAEGRAVTAATQASDEHAGHHAPASAPRHERHDAPAHCPASMACAAMTLAIVDVSLSEDGSVRAQALQPGDDTLPRSPGQAPETPPPRG